MSEPQREIWYMGGKVPNRSQALFAGLLSECRERYYLGTPGCGKTSSIIAEVNRHLIQAPGAVALLARYQETESASVLKGFYEEETDRALLERWDHEERRWYFKPIGGKQSSVYIHGLKPAEGQAPFSKFAGYNLSLVAISQGEGVPVEYIEKLYERLRNPIGPRLLLVEGNVDVNPDHWLFSMVTSAVRVQERVYRSGTRLIVIGNLDDNARNLPQEYVEGLRAKYPPGHPEHGPKVSGAFGVIVQGTPVYGELFRPSHLIADGYRPDLPIYVSWDFGLARPAISWHQSLPKGKWRIWGEHLGDGTPLEELVPEFRRLSQEYCPNARQIWHVGDPTGANRKDTGLSSIKYLQRAGIPITPARGGNLPSVRAGCIENVRAAMLRRSSDGEEAFGVHPRCAILRDGFSRGYVRDKNRQDGLPRKDGYFDHLQNTVEYAVASFWGMQPQATGEAPLKELLNAREPGEPKDRTLARQHAGGF